MNAILSVQAVVDEMDSQSDEIVGYLNKRTGELITLTTEELSLAEEEIDINDCPEWQKELIEKAKEVLDSDEYLTLPNKYDIHEYRIMEEFCYSIPDQRQSEKLLDAIRGRGAFRRFKDAINLLDIDQQWYSFRQSEFEKIAIAWLEENGIAYRR